MLLSTLGLSFIFLFSNLAFARPTPGFSPNDFLIDRTDPGSAFYSLSPLPNEVHSPSPRPPSPRTDGKGKGIAVDGGGDRRYAPEQRKAKAATRAQLKKNKEPLKRMEDKQRRKVTELSDNSRLKRGRQVHSEDEKTIKLEAWKAEYRKKHPEVGGWSVNETVK
ncbi:hypothetical protein C8J56DRAFT_879992 [Mycena floridula]|nr:hypothetical protein C8J56DRAFT_879992 [Mycena floridula]